MAYITVVSNLMANLITDPILSYNSFERKNELGSQTGSLFQDKVNLSKL